MNQDDLASLSISEIAQQLAALAASMRELAGTPIFDTPENYERMRTGGDPRKPHRASDMPDERREMFDAEIDRLARGEGYGEEP